MMQILHELVRPRKSSRRKPGPMNTVVAIRALPSSPHFQHLGSWVPAFAGMTLLSEMPQ